MESTNTGNRYNRRRFYTPEEIYQRERQDFMNTIHSPEAHKKCLHPDVNVFITDFLTEAKDIFDEYPEISPTSIFERYQNDEKNGVKRIVYDVIPAEQYRNLLKRYVEMGEFARIPKDVVVSWYNKIKRNTVILYYISYMYHRKWGFPFEIIPFETDDVEEAQKWIMTKTNFYRWAVFSNGAPGYADRPFEQLFPILREYREDMTPEQVLILVNRLIQVSHPAGRFRDFSECFIEGGRKTCDSITNG